MRGKPVRLGEFFGSYRLCEGLLGDGEGGADMLDGLSLEVGGAGRGGGGRRGREGAVPGNAALAASVTQWRTTVPRGTWMALRWRSFRVPV
jgi:hypothetical protein